LISGKNINPENFGCRKDKVRKICDLQVFSLVPPKMGSPNFGQKSHLQIEYRLKNVKKHLQLKKYLLHLQRLIQLS
jgi:hypothetical protein